MKMLTYSLLPINILVFNISFDQKNTAILAVFFCLRFMNQLNDELIKLNGSTILNNTQQRQSIPVGEANAAC